MSALLLLLFALAIMHNKGWLDGLLS